MTVNVGTTIKRGSVPFVTPIKFALVFVMAATAIEPALPASVADTLTAGDDCAIAGFVKLNVTTQAVPDVVPPMPLSAPVVPSFVSKRPLLPGGSMLR